ncbi:MAG: DUF1566 domain-containing protein [Terracidiphilus sp.]|jgi:tetratricopeptide (TPR) repeat protein
MLLCLALCGTVFTAAQSSNAPATWWPDASTGLMWSGQTMKGRMNWKEANDYCSSLQFGGYSGWRLPTLDEINTIVYYKHYKGEWQRTCKSVNARPLDVNDKDCENEYSPSYDSLQFTLGTRDLYASTLWTSNMYNNQRAWVVMAGQIRGVPSFMHSLVDKPDHNHFGVILTRRLMNSALCTRPIEADLLQIAINAEASRPVPDVLALKAYLPLSKAHQAYMDGQFQESIDLAKSALLVKPDFAPAYWAMGLSYGKLGQWDLAMSNFEAALKIDKDYGDAKSFQKWAKESQKAAKTGKRIKTQSPEWY